jgi:hypothetical protein
MSRESNRSMLGRRGSALVAALALLLAALVVAGRESRADQGVDLTLLFQSAVQGKISPCG